MKAQTKAIVASLAVIALALSAVSGVTYSWFSDSEQTDITVTTGSIEIEDFTPSVSYSESPWTDWKVVEANWTTDSAGKKILSASVPPIGDNAKIKVAIPDISIVNTIQTNYYEQISVKDSSGEKSSYFTYKGAIEAAISFDPISDDIPNSVPSHEIILAFDSEGKAQSQTFTISLEFTAIQANAPTPGGISATVSESEDTVLTVSTENEGSVSVTIPKGSEGSSVVAKEANSETAKQYTAVASKKVVSGIDIDGYDSDKNKITDYLKDTAVTLKMVIDGDYSKRGLTIYHGNDIFTVGAGESIDIIYDAVADKTIVTIVTKQGFSPYFATFDPVASIGNTDYNSIQDAINAATDGQTIKVLKDVNIKTMLVISAKTIILDMNGKKIFNTSDFWNEETGVWSLISIRSSGDLTITGNGILQAKENDCFSIDVQDGSKLTILNGKYVGNMDVVYVYEGTAYIKGGEYSIQQKNDDATKAYDFMINLFDTNRKNGTASAVISGGVFENFNPQDCWAEGEHTNFCADGYITTSSKATVDGKEVTFYFVITSGQNNGSILPAGVTANSFGSNTVYDGEKYYATMKDALKGIHNKNINTLWCKPGANVGEMTHGHVCKDLTIYGNHAYISSGESEFEIDTYLGPDGGSDLSSDVTLKVYSLDKSGAWGQRLSNFKITLIFEDCKEMGRIYFSNAVGTMDVTVKGCSFGSQDATAIYMNTPGKITVENTLFHGYALAVNLTNKSTSEQIVSIKNCVFVDNGLSMVHPDWDSFKAPVRIVAYTDGSSSKLTTSDCTFIYSSGNTPVYGDFRFGDTRSETKAVSGSVTWNGIRIIQDQPMSS